MLFRSMHQFVCEQLESLKMRQKRRSGRLHRAVDVLEQRVVPVTTTLVNGVLTVTFDQAADPIVTVSQVDEEAEPVSINGSATTFFSFNVFSIVVTPGLNSAPAANTIDLSGIRRAAFARLVSVSIDGGGGADSITGSKFADYIVGGVGNQRILGGEGNDTILAGVGNDTVDGGIGHDSIIGDLGDDVLSGGLDNDQVNGGAGHDTINGDGGNDVLFGGAQRDSIDGGAGDDIIRGHGASNTLRGGSGNDRIYGSDSPNRIFGGSGNDLLIGGDNADTLSGDEDNDRIFGRAGADQISSGSGNDFASGELGDDTLLGDAGDDTLRGSDGNDRLDGGDDSDDLAGGEGNDRVSGGLGADAIAGDAGDDTLTAGVEISVVDTTNGGAGQDTLIDPPGQEDIITLVENTPVSSDTVYYQLQQFTEIETTDELAEGETDSASDDSHELINLNNFRVQPEFASIDGVSSSATTTAISNLTGTYINTTEAVSPTQRVGLRLQVGTTSRLNLTTLSAVLGVASGSPTVQYTIYANSNNGIGAVVGVTNAISISGSNLTAYSLGFSSPVTLARNTVYHIVLSSTSAGVTWGRPSDGSNAAGSELTLLATTRYSVNGGGLTPNGTATANVGFGVFGTAVAPRRVVVIDGAFDLDHEYFGPDRNGDQIADRIVFQHDFADNDDDANPPPVTATAPITTVGHGTHVASIVASSDLTVGGASPDVELVLLKVGQLNALGQFTLRTSAIQSAVDWVIRQATNLRLPNDPIIENIVSVNLSLGRDNFNTFGEGADLDDLAARFTALATNNVIVVAAAGNSFGAANLDGTALPVPGISTPAILPNVISVGSVYDRDIGDEQHGFGARSTTTGIDRIVPSAQRAAGVLDVLAPGGSVDGARFGGGRIAITGTSMASPHIAGIVAPIQELAEREIGRHITSQEFEQLLRTVGARIFDGDDENDNVINTNAWYRRLDMVALGHAVMALDPNDTNHADAGKVVINASEFGFANDGQIDEFTVRLNVATPLLGVFQDRTVTDLQVLRGNTIIFQRQFDAVDSLEIVGSSDSDRLIVDTASGNPIPVNGMKFDGGSGDDVLNATQATFTALRSVTLLGGAGNDRLIGGPGDDWISGGTENDTLSGGAGNDVLIEDVGGVTPTTLTLTATTLTGIGNDTFDGFEAASLVG